MVKLGFVSQLPFTHMGMQYERLSDGGVAIYKYEHLLAIKPIPVSYPKDLSQVLDSQLQSSFRSLLCSVLYDLQTRMDIACEITQLQTYNKAATYLQLKQANGLLKRAQEDCRHMGLYFRPLVLPLKLASVADASHATASSSYAQEGGLILLCHDSPLRTDLHHKILAADIPLVGGLSLIHI